MDPISKLLARLTAGERKRLKKVLEQLQRQDLKGLDVKKFSGLKDLYRVRVGAFRIHLRKTKAGIFYAINLERRTSTSYRKRGK